MSCTALKFSELLASLLAGLRLLSLAHLNPHASPSSCLVGVRIEVGLTRPL